MKSLNDLFVDCHRNPTSFWDIRPPVHGNDSLAAPRIDTAPATGIFPNRPPRNRVLLVVSLLFMAQASIAAPPVVAPRPLDAIVHSVAADYIHKCPKSVLVIAVSTPAGHRCWGFGQLANGQMPNEKTLFEIGSITKTMTGTLLAKLVLENKVRWDDPVCDYFPDDWTFPRRNNRDISLLHLATHTSSLPRMPTDFAGFMALQKLAGKPSWDDPYANYKMPDLKRSLASIELTRPIGSKMAYSNLGMGLLGQALARADDHEDPAILFRERLLKPLSLDDTRFEIPKSDRDRLAPPFDADGSPEHTWHFAALKCCGGIRSTAADMLRYGDAVTGRIKTPLAPAFNLALQKWRKIGSNRFIGLAWFRRSFEIPGQNGRETTLAWHSGATGGYRAFLGILPEFQTTLIILANSTQPVDPKLSWPILLHVAKQ